MTKKEIAAMRKDYTSRSFSEAEALSSPFDQFRLWFDEAVMGQILEPNAMALATATPEGRPSARTVLLKGFDDNGFVFFTNYESRKGQDLSGNPYAALLFTWLELERQIRIEGKIEKIQADESRAYYISRPKSSQIGAWASPQSRVIPSRMVLEDKVESLTRQYADAEYLPLPDFWGGYILIPDCMEFWQGRESRLHDRMRYTLGDEGWKVERLAP